jgi:molecular chaperone GrpE
MGAPKKTSHPLQFAEAVSRRLSYRLRRKHYADAVGPDAAPKAAAAPPTVARILAEREQQIAKLTEDNAALRDLALRARADLDNARKRFQREKADIIKFATEQLLRELVAVLDNLERALASANGGADAKAVHDGVQMVLDQFSGILRAHGLEPIASDGQPFDPHFHEAVSTEEREAAMDNQIVATFQKGYLLRGRVVRPAMVRVARAVRPAPTRTPTPAPAPATEAIAPSAVTGEETIADLDDPGESQPRSPGKPDPAKPTPSPDK